MKIWGLLVAVLIPLSALANPPPRPATDAEIAVARDALQDKLLDADSAKFRDVQFRQGDNGGGTICGLINAKNSYGAYTGFRNFVVFVDEVNGQMTPSHPGIDSGSDTLIAEMCKITMS